MRNEMKDKKMIKQVGRFFVCFLLTLTMNVLTPEQIKVFAQSQTVPDKVLLSTSYEDFGEYNIVCGKKKQLKLPSSFKKVTFQSSNKKVATVTKNAIVQAKCLGVAKITAKSNGKKKVYKITVVPKKVSDLKLNRTAVLVNESAQLKVVSDKYDTSQLKVSFSSNYMGLDHVGMTKTGKVSAIYSSDNEATLATRCSKLIISYGNYTWQTYFFRLDGVKPYICETEALMPYHYYYYNGDYSDTMTLKEKQALFGYYVDYRVDGVRRNPYAENITLKPGNHTLKIGMGEKTVTHNFVVMEKPALAIKTGNSAGYNKEDAQVIDTVHAIVSDPSVIQSGMSDREKVKAIHDYIILHADYDYGYYDERNHMTDEDKNKMPSKVSRERFSAYGVLVNHTGVCESYANAFYMCMKALDIPCKVINGMANGMGGWAAHAWNQVLVDGKWYYIDCTWDDIGHLKKTDSQDQSYDAIDEPLIDPDLSDETLQELCGISHAVILNNSNSFSGIKYDWFLSDTLWPDHKDAEEKYNKIDDSVATWKGLGFLYPKGYAGER